MKDLASEFTEKKINQLTKRIDDIYTQSYIEIDKKANDYFSKFKVNFKEMTEKLNNEEITKTQFKNWYQRAVIVNNKWIDLRKEISNDLINADKLAAAIINNEIPLIFAENCNFASFLIDKNINAYCGFNVYDKNTVLQLLKGNKILPNVEVNVDKAMLWNERHIQSAILQGTIQGDSIEHLSKRLRQVADMDRKQAIRTARSTMTSAQNGGRQASYEQAEELGIKLKKQWLSTHDDRTRSSHIFLDGQVVDVNESFKNIDGEEITFPGDPKAPPADYYNCRCTMISVIDKTNSDISNRVHIKNGLSYEEWKSHGEKKG